MTNATDRLSFFVFFSALILSPAPAIAATGGPDAFGYTFIDSLSPGGPAFMGHDISTTGVFFAGGDDVTTGGITLMRPFNFYGRELTQISASSNGYISSNPADTGSDSTNDCPLPASVGGSLNGRIYPLHDDLVSNSMHVQYFASCPRAADNGTGTIGCTIVQWNNVTHSGVPGSIWDQWAYLYDNCDIVIEIGPGNPEQGSGSTTGIQNDAAATGLTVACNTPSSVPNSYAVLFEFPCAQASGGAGGGLAPPTTSLSASGMTVINASTGTINSIVDPAYRGGGIFYFNDIDIMAGATVTFLGATAPELRATGNITLNGTINLNGAVGLNSTNGQPGAALVAGRAGGGHGGAGGCAVAWESRLAQRGGGTTGGFGGTHPAGSAGFADVTGGGGGGNGTAGTDGDPPIGAFTTERGRGGSANLSPIVSPLRGGGGGAGGGCDVDDAAGARGTGTSNDGGSSGGAGGGAIRLQADGNITVGASGSITANGGKGGDNSGNGAAAGGGAGGTVLLIAGGSLTHGGSITATGGARGVLMQAGAGANGGVGGVGIIGLYDSDGVIAGAGTANPAAVTGMSPVFAPADLVIDNLDLPNASPSQPYAATITASGGSGAYTFSVASGALPTSLTIDSMTGLISGTSTTAAGIRSTFTIRVDDGTSTYDRAFCILTLDSSLAFATDALPSTDVMTAYSQTINVVGSTGTLVYRVDDGALPSGLMLNTSTGAITGTTGMNKEAATFTINIASGLDQNDSLTFSILSPETSAATPILAPLPDAEECVPYAGVLMPTLGTPPYSFELMGGALPGAMALNPITGAITGAPPAGSVAASPFNVCIFVYDAVGFLGKVSLDFVVVPPSAPPTCTLVTPMASPAVGNIVLQLIASGGGCAMAVDVLAIEYSLDGGVTFVGPCTAAASSAVNPPQVGVSTTLPINFVWASPADMVATMSLETNVVVRASIMDGFGNTSCSTSIFTVDNQCLCGDCDLSGSLPPSIIDALVAAQMAVGLTMPTALQARCCDPDSTTTITIIDALFMAQASAGLPAVLMCP